MNVESGLCGSILPAVKQLVMLGLIATAIKITTAQATRIGRQMFHFIRSASIVVKRNEFSMI